MFKNAFKTAALCAVALACVATALSAASNSHPDYVAELPDYGQLLSNNYAGYIPVPDGRKAFYWFVESEGSPKDDPLVVWLQGGPGCSSVMGNLEENGAYVMRLGGNFVLNEFRWSTNANMLYIESPPGVGFSQDTVPATLWDDNSTAVYNYEALKGFFLKHPAFKANKLFVTGESYAGHYVPQLANQILEGDDLTIRGNMQGFMVGNPCTGDIGCPNFDPTLEPYLRYHGLAALNQSIPTVQNANYDPYDYLVPTCPNIQMANQIQFSHPIVDALKKRLAAAPIPYGPCADTFVHNWINRADVKAALHAPINITWAACNPNIKYTVQMTGVTDLYEKFFKQTQWAIMIYSGTADTIVNFVQTQTIVNEFKRPLKNPEFTPWNYPYVYNSKDTQLGGFYLEFDRISWAGVRDAGHMVPQFNPPAAKELFMSFITTGKPGRM